MKLGTSLRFLYPTGAHTHALFKQILASMPPGSFIERPLGATDTGEQARNVLEVAAAARAAGLDGLLYGDNHAVPAEFANSFAPIPTLARLMAVTGEMPVGLVLLAPFYHPIVLAEQIGTIAAFATAPLIVTLANGGRAQAFEAFGIPMSSRAARLEDALHRCRDGPAREVGHPLGETARGGLRHQRKPPRPHRRVGGGTFGHARGGDAGGWSTRRQGVVAKVRHEDQRGGSFLSANGFSRLEREAGEPGNCR